MSVAQAKGTRVMPEMESPAEYAAAVATARDRLVGFVGQCSDASWKSISAAEGDPRPVGVIVDHVADAYEYLARWIQAILDGESVDVTEQVVDELNARHGLAASHVTRSQAAAHLKTSGDMIVALIRSLPPAALDLDRERVRRFARIAALHADSHRREVESPTATER
jgi:hypothetical protein